MLLSLSLTLTTPSNFLFSFSSPKDSPLPVIQRLRVGLESIDASEITLGGFRLPLLLCGCSLQQLLYPRHPPSPTAAASHQFLSSFPHSSSSLPPGHDYHDITSPSLSTKLIFCRARRPSTSYHNSLGDSAVDEIRCHPSLRAVHKVG